MSSTNTEQQAPDRRQVLRLAADADVDVRTAAKFLRGEPVKGLAADRCRRVIAKDSTP
jgi:hypothetical protein